MIALFNHFHRETVREKLFERIGRTRVFTAVRNFPLCMVEGIDMARLSLFGVGYLATLLVVSTAHRCSLADNWSQFRGPNAAGVSADSQLLLTWSETENLRWKVELPGPGSSSPIVHGDRVYITSYSGYGLPGDTEGDVNSLKRQLTCVDRLNGTLVWTTTVPGTAPEDLFQGYISEHGYASNTPVTDGERVFCFFGKSGVVAFDLQGKQLWKTKVGSESSIRRWGSGASLILYKNLLIVNAAEESQSLRALDQTTGEEVWKVESAALELAYGTPGLVELNDGRTDLVMALPGESWGLNPETGLTRWRIEHELTGTICPSIISDKETIFIFGGFRSAGSLALKLNAEEEDAAPELLWTSRISSYVATPLLFEGHLYWIDDRGHAFCISASTGELVYRERVSEFEAGGRPVYASPVLAAGKIYVQSRWAGMLILAAKPEYELLAQNRFTTDESDFNATPAIVAGELFVRSNRYLYCVNGQQK